MTEMKIAVGLVCGNTPEEFKGKWNKRWYEQASHISDNLIIIDNSTDGTGDYFVGKPKVKYYLKQENNERHMNRDYQMILDFARKLKATWVFNLDLDEVIDPARGGKELLTLAHGGMNEGMVFYSTYRFPLFEMRGDEDHYVLSDGGKDCRGVSKFYKVLPQYVFDPDNTHGSSIPENIENLGPVVDLKIKHLGHMTRKQRDDKRKQYDTQKKNDILEQEAFYMKEEDILIEKWKGWDWNLKREDSIFGKTNIIMLAHKEPEKFIKSYDTILETANSDITPFDITVVNNDADEKILEHIKNKKPSSSINVRILNSGGNIGTSKGFNAGAYHSLPDTKYVCFFNTDYYMEKDWLRKMILCFNHKKKIGLIGCMTNVTGSKEEKCESSKKLPNKYIKAECANAQMFTTKEIFDEVGGFDENIYPVEFEDLDLNESIKAKGYDVYVNGKVFGFHDHDVKKHAGRQESRAKNREYFKKKWGDKYKWA